MGFLVGAGKFFKAVPLWVWAVIGLVVGVYFYGGYKYNAGEANKQAQWDESVERGKVIVDKLKAVQQKVTTVVEVKVEYKNRIITQKAKDRVQIQEVFVPVDSGVLSGGFRLFYDAAVTDTIPNPAEIFKANPVPVTAVATNANANYKLCHEAYSIVEGWQEWANEMCSTNSDGCPDAR